MLAIADCGSFTEAADRCFISQSAISQQVASLEAELGVRLIEREGRRCRLTPAGEYFARRSRTILAEAAELRRETVRIGSDSELFLNIGYLSGYDGQELPRAVAAFSETYPEVVVSVFKGTHEELYRAILNGKANFLLSDQRRAFSDECENYILNQSPAYIDVAIPVSSFPTGRKRKRRGATTANISASANNSSLPRVWTRLAFWQ